MCMPVQGDMKAAGRAGQWWRSQYSFVLGEMIPKVLTKYMYPNEHLKISFFLPALFDPSLSPESPAA